MQGMAFTLRTILPLVIAMASLMNLCIAATPTSFCKCTCFTNSTIIPLDAPASPPLQNRNAFEGLNTARSPAEEDSDSDRDGKGQDRKEYRAGNCNDCNRQFCLDYNLPICKKASMEDVFTTCFQRDSRKDEAVVFIFIIATVGLLGWAGVKPWVGKWVDNARERRSYVPVSSGDT